MLSSWKSHLAKVNKTTFHGSIFSRTLKSTWKCVIYNFVPSLSVTYLIVNVIAMYKFLITIKQLNEQYILRIYHYPIHHEIIPYFEIYAS